MFKKRKMTYRKELEECLEKTVKDFEKNHKSDDKILQRIRGSLEKVKEDLLKKKESVDVVVIRKDLDHAIKKIHSEVTEIFPEVEEKLKNFFDNVVETIAKLMEKWHIRDETAKLHAEIEKSLSEMSQTLEKENVKNDPKVKEIHRQLKKITENTAKEIGRLLDDFKNGKDVQEDVDENILQIYHDLGEFGDEIGRKVRLEIEKISLKIYEKFNLLKRTINQLKLCEAERHARKAIELKCKIKIDEVGDNPEALEILEGLRKKAESLQLEEKLLEVRREVRVKFFALAKEIDEKIAGGISAKFLRKIRTEGRVSGVWSIFQEFRKEVEGMRQPKEEVEKLRKKPGLKRNIGVMKKIHAVFFGIFLFFFNTIPKMLKDFFLLFKPKNVNGKVVLITGTGGGLGRALAKKFAKLGATVACVDVNSAANEETRLELEKKSGMCVRMYTCDISKPDKCRELAREIFEHFGRVDILINNAGILACHRITEGSDEDLRKVIDVNLLANFWMVRAFLPRMIETKRGQIVFINSASGIHGLAMSSSYAASKAGLLGLAYSLDNELRLNPHLSNIKVTSVHPLYFKTGKGMEETVGTHLMSASDVADMAVHGIRRNLFAFTIPMVYGGFGLGTLIRLLPTRIYHPLVQSFGGIQPTAQPYFRDPLPS